MELQLYLVQTVFNLSCFNIIVIYSKSKCIPSGTESKGTINNGLVVIFSVYWNASYVTVPTNTLSWTKENTANNFHQNSNFCSTRIMN